MLRYDGRLHQLSDCFEDHFEFRIVGAFQFAQPAIRRRLPRASDLLALVPPAVLKYYGTHGLLQIMIGTTVAHYRILAKLGGGGMGVVYKAEDIRLGRDVALKVLPADVAHDASRRARFEQEARSASALNHPNIITVYDLGAGDGMVYIVTELVEGESLRDLILRGPVPVRKLLDIGVQLADGLAAAHAAGIIHRDLKPENIMLTRESRVKILDFGLAKQAGHLTPDGPTASLAQTSPGTVLGTVGYMSPEQARGEELDARTDLFSYGAVLYEMATGRRAFSGATTAVIFDAILHKAPAPPTQPNAVVPAELERIINKALEKECALRYQSVSDLLSDLRRLARDADSERAAQTPASSAVARPSSLRKVIDSLAVLPFENASSEPEAEYFSDGITESIINSISELPKIRVMARTTVFRYKGQPVDPLAVGRQLNVRAVLTGRVMQRGGSLIIGAELVEATNGWRLWGKQYQRPLQDVFTVQEEIAREISENLRVKLTGREKKRLARRPTQNREAYELYLKGRFFSNKRTEESIRKGIEYFRQAMELDPTYAPAYAGLAESYMPLGYWGYLPPHEAFPKVKAWALKALDIDNQLAEAHSALATARGIYDWDMESSEKGLQQAIRLNPNYARARQCYAEQLTWLGEFEAAEHQLHQALALDPLSAILHTVDAYNSYFARRYDEVIPKCRRSLEIEPTFPPAHYFLGMVMEQFGRFEEAVDHLQMSLQAAARSTMFQAGLGRAYGLWGKRDKAQDILKGLERTMEERYVPAYSFAEVYAGLADTERTLLWLERATQERSSRMVLLNVDPTFDTLRSGSQFQDLLRRARLPARGRVRAERDSSLRSE
jgi:serine/threonine protein kinase/tetratricopeptide (TPR) repeat protein